MRSMLDLSLLQSPTFMILAFSGFLTLFCFFVPFAFLGALADERRINSNLNNNDPSNNSSANAIAGGGKGSSQLLLVLLGNADIPFKHFLSFSQFQVFSMWSGVFSADLLPTTRRWIR
jgi:hypothetical protein